MLFTSERASPWNARVSRSSLLRSTSSVSPSWRTVMSPGSSRARAPFGPLTATERPSMVTSTPLGTGMGALPMRDMLATPPSPDVAEDLAADATLARLTVGHEPLAGGHDCDTEAAEHPGDAIGLGVDTKTRLRDALDPGDHALALGRVLHVDSEGLAGLALALDHAVAGDEAFLVKHLREGFLQLRRRHRDVVVHRDVGVADAREHVGDGIGHRHGAPTSPTNWPSSRRAARPRARARAGRRGKA